MGDRVAVLKDGYLQQIDTPQNLYDKPGNVFVAAFIGSPSMNLVEATVDGDGVRFGEHRLPLTRPPALSRAVLGIRPETFEDAAFAPGLPTIRVRVEVLEELGSDAHVCFHVVAPPSTAEILESAGDESLLAQSRALFTARVDARTRARVGDELELAVDPARVHFFDPETGNRFAPAGTPELVGAH
jgi:multiple sugar transport system ATP-binding protein